MNIPIGEFSGSNATNELRRTIERIQAENARQSRWMLALTAIAAIAALIAAWPVVKDWLHAVNVLWRERASGEETAMSDDDGCLRDSEVALMDTLKLIF
jgi:hypothetical protein